MRRSEIRDLIALTVERRYPAGDYTGYRGKAAPYVEVVLGYRYVRDSFSAGVDGTLHVFHRVDFMSDVGGVPTGVATIGTSWLLGPAVSVAFRGLSF
jgi:hypothetical protein